MQKEDRSGELDKKLAAVCGLYCEACSLFIPQRMILKGSNGLQHKCIFRRKRANAMDAGRTRDCLIARNARCSLAQLNVASTFA